MANRVTMTICGTEYTLIAEEDAAYMEKVGAMVDKEMRELMDTAHRPGPGIPSGESLVWVRQDNVLPVLLKKQEAGQGLILRLLETQGRDTQADLTILGRPFPVAVGAWAIETYLYENGTLTPTNLLEEPEN